jgi:hypothetical protein
MKTTLEISDQLFRHANSLAAEQGIPLRELVTEALSEKIRVHREGGKPWLKSFGKLRSLRSETARINRIIAETLERIETADWR